jgi:uncharacterized surface protein with fasciclin (FAS1) repeats
MKKTFFKALLLPLLLALPAAAAAQLLPGIPDNPPPASATDSIAGTLEKGPQFATLSRIIKTSSIAPVLATSPRLTFFAPTEASFSRMDKKVLDALFTDSETATTFVKSHVVIGRFPKEKLEAVFTLSNLAQQPLEIVNHGTTVQGNTISQFDLWCRNGVIHEISGPLALPK